MAIYMIYTYIADKNKTVYGYIIYLFIICILIIADTIYMKRKSKTKLYIKHINVIYDNDIIYI